MLALVLAVSACSDDEPPPNSQTPNNSACVGQADPDEDGLAGECDNCPDTPNTDQADEDGDGVGDACDVCPGVVDPDQADADDDGVGDACDLCVDTPDPDQADTDGDGIGDLCDNCPETENPNQLNEDDDEFGNACDNCPPVTNPDQSDIDGNGFGDLCDGCIPGGDINYEEVYFDAMTDNDQIRIEDGIVGRFTADEYDDIVLLNFQNERIHVFESVPDPQGDNEFFQIYDTIQPGSGPDSLAAIDINNDGFSEIAASNVFDISIIPNNADGNERDFVFDDEAIYETDQRTPTKILVGDFDADGFEDIATLFDSGFGVFFNDGQGGLEDFRALEASLDEGLAVHDMVVGDFDDNPGTDVVILQGENNAVLLTQFTTDGAPVGTTFSIPTERDQEYTLLAEGSINQNGTLDLALLAPSRNDGNTIPAEFRVMANDGAGTFSDYYGEVLGIQPSTILFADVGFNGFADVVLGGYFFKHSDTEATYAGGRTQIEYPMRPIRLLFANVNDDRAGELIAVEELKLTVLTPTCP